MGWNQQTIDNLAAAATAAGLSLADMPADWNGQVVWLLEVLAVNGGLSLDGEPADWNGKMTFLTGLLASVEWNGIPAGDIVAAANVVTGNKRYEPDGAAGTYPATATSKAEQRAADVVILSNAAANVEKDAVILPGATPGTLVASGAETITEGGASNSYAFTLVSLATDIELSMPSDTPSASCDFVGCSNMRTLVLTASTISVPYTALTSLTVAGCPMTQVGLDSLVDQLATLLVAGATITLTVAGALFPTLSANLTALQATNTVVLN